MKKNDLDPRLAELLSDLDTVPARSPRATARGKNKFLAEAVSLSEKKRHSWWTTIFQPKENFAMNLILSFFVLAGLLFGSGATVAAAQDALPTDALYQIKLISEDAQLWLTTDPAAEIGLFMQQAQSRTEEMAALNSQGIIPPAGLTIRAQDRIEQALQLTATLDGGDVTTTLLQIRDRLQTQDRLLSQLQDGTCTDCEPTLAQTRDMLQTQLRQVEDGLTDPQGFVNRHRNQTGVATSKPAEIPVTDQPANMATGEPAATEIPAMTPQGSHTPALDGTGSQNGAMGTPRPQNATGQQNGQEPGNNPNPDSGGQNGRP